MTGLGNVIKILGIPVVCSCDDKTAGSPEKRKPTLKKLPLLRARALREGQAAVGDGSVAGADVNVFGRSWIGDGDRGHSRDRGAPTAKVGVGGDSGRGGPCSEKQRQGQDKACSNSESNAS